MKNLLLLLCLFSLVRLSAQSGGIVKGTITDMEMGGEPLMFAQVSLEDTAWHTETNFHGNFELPHIIPGSYVLKIESLGYETLTVSVEVTANNIVQVDKGLHAKTISLEDVPVTTLHKSTAFTGQ